MTTVACFLFRAPVWGEDAKQEHTFDPVANADDDGDHGDDEVIPNIYFIPVGRDWFNIMHNAIPALEQVNVASTGAGYTE